MEPLKPETKRSILALRADVSLDEIEEYERLLSLTFVSDPDAPAVPPGAPAEKGVPPAGPEARRLRLEFLHRKLFGPR